MLAHLALQRIAALPAAITVQLLVRFIALGSVSGLHFPVALRFAATLKVACIVDIDAKFRATVKAMLHLRYLHHHLPRNLIAALVMACS
jgi:hypothetical protein